jgi:hypothetical protein
MVGFALALAGGALQGWGDAQKDAAKRDAEHLKATALATLNNQFQAGLQEQRINFEKGEGTAERASREKLTAATLAQTASSEKARLSMEEKLANLQSATTIKGYESTASNVDKQLAAQRDIAMAGIESDEKRTTQQIAANKELAEIQQAGAWKPTLVMNADGKTSRTVLMNDAGKYNELPIDTKTGKPLNPVLTDTDTEPARNYKFLISQGVPEAEAVERAFAKGDNKDALALGYFDALSKAASAGIKPLGPDEQTELHRLADLMAGKIPAADATTTAPAAGATTPAPAAAPAAVPASSSTTVAPPAPTDRADRVTGQTYTTPNGNTAVWTGTGWRVVNPAAPATGSPPSG